MPVYRHDELPVHDVPRIRTRILVSQELGATETTVWEQWIDEGGYIPLHYHEVEEVLVLLDGRVELTIDDEVSIAVAPATVVVSPQQVHGLKPADSATVHLMAFFPTATPEIFSPDGTQRKKPWEDTDG